MANEDFTVTLLDNPKVEGTAFPRSGREGLAKSIAAVPVGKVRPASTHISIARILSPRNDKLWRWYDVNTEAACLVAAKDYDVVKRGETPFVLIVNGQTFSHDTDAMLKYVQGIGELDGRKNVGLVSNSIPLSGKYADRVLGEKVVWALKDGKIQEVPVSLFTLGQYIEAQRDPQFMQRYPVFIAVLSGAEAQKYGHNKWLKLRENEVYSPEKRLVEHVPSHIMAGTKEVWEMQLRVAAENRQYNTFYAGMPQLAENSGRVAIVNLNYGGFNFNITGSDGCSVGVAPEALDALVSTFIAFREPPTRIKREITQLVLSLPTDQMPAGLEQGLDEIFARYQPVKDR